MTMKPPPQTDIELIREFDARLRRLETAATTRIGDWVLSDRDGALIATKPGEVQDVGQDVVAPITSDLTRGFIVDIDQAKEEVENNVTEAVTGTPGPLATIFALLSGKWADIVTADGKGTTAGNNVQSTWDRFREAVLGGTISGSTVNDFKTSAQAVNTTAGTANTNATTALGIGNTVKTRFDIRVRAGSNAAADLGFENPAMYMAGAVRDTAQPRTGTYSARLTGTGSSTVQLPITVDQTGIVSYTCAGVDTIYFEAYVYGKATNNQSSGGTNGLQLAVIPYNIAGSALTTVIAANLTTTTALNGAWTKVSGTATLPSNAASFAAFVQLTSSCNNGQIYYVDDVIVREVTTGFLAQLTANTGVTNAATAQGTADTAQAAASATATRLETRIKAGSNLVADPSFENTSMYVSGGTPARSNEQARTGTYSVKMTGTGSGNVIAYSTVNTAGTLAYYASGSDVYYYEAWIYGKATNTQSSGGTNGFQLVLATYDRTGAFIANVVAASQTTTTALNSVWTKVSGYATVASNVATVVGYFQLTSTCNSGQVFYVDDVIIRESTRAQAAKDAADAAQATANTGVANAATAIANAGTAQSAADAVANRLQTRLKAGANLATDPSFEDTTVYVSGGTPARSTEQARTGTYSVKMTGTGSSTVTTYVTTTTSGTLSYYANGSDAYIFEVWVRGKSTNVQSSGGVNGLQLVLATYDRTGTFIANVVAASKTTTTALNGTWTKVSGVAVVASNVATIIGMVTLTSACNSGEVYYVDDVVLREQTQLQKLADSLLNVHTGGSSSGNAVDAWVTHMQGVWQDLFGHDTPQSVLQDSAIPDITRGMSSDLDELYGAHVDAVGSGARIVRTSTSNVTISNANTGPVYLPASFYNYTAESSADITVDLVSGGFEVSLEGWYRVDIAFKINSSLSAIWNICPVVFVNGSVRAYLGDGCSQSTGGVRLRTIHDSVEVYLFANDIVLAGYDAANATGTISNVLTGEATGSQCYCSISLTNRSLA